ncbi:zinc finger domain-containing protein [Longimycelium tulufanense]|uniref:zinc finger domain-containing protein n=1 Tax=Longimycelium tulufanense TaxID=907463 RepID=UPI00402B3C61
MEKPSSDVMAVACPLPSCRAQPGQPCRSPGGYVERKPHAQRLIVAADQPPLR